jgi:hypothetical protein
MVVHMLLQDYIGERGLVKGKLVPLKNISFSLGNLLTSFFFFYIMSAIVLVLVFASIGMIYYHILLPYLHAMCMNDNGSSL